MRRGLHDVEGVWMSTVKASGLPIVDERQLVRIEAVHRGFLYQHLYAAHCLLRAGGTGALRVSVERDEDVEIARHGHHVYIQVKTRIGALAPADVAGALARFAEIRLAHERGARPGGARFVIAANAPPSLTLAALRTGRDWPTDVELHWPDGPDPEPGLPRPFRDVPEALGACAALAATLPFAALRPETLAWKLAGAVMLAASGSPPRQDHAFERDELPTLFEQLVVQMQDLPAPPSVYRSQVDEPPLATDDRVRIVAGLSGAGKTAWVAQAALHSRTPVTYLDAADIPGAAVASAVAREVAARMSGRSHGALGEILLPGAAPLDLLGALSARLGQDRLLAHVVLDNAHGLPAADVRAIVDRAPNIRFLLLCHPGAAVVELETFLDVRAETLSGWDEDTIAAAAADAGCRADYADCERLSRLTGALPFYVLNAAVVAAREYGGSMAGLCADLEAQTNVVATAQQIILRRAFAGLSADQRETVTVLSLADVALPREEAVALIRQACCVDERGAASRLRALPSTGMLEMFGNAGLKVHDAVRLLGRSDAAERGPDFERTSRAALRAVMMESIKRTWSVAKLRLLVRLFGELGESAVLVEFATDELFHEMGVWPEIEPFLVTTAEDPAQGPETRLWALDGLALNELREGRLDAASSRTDAMKALLDLGGLGSAGWLAWAMKRMLVLTGVGDMDGVIALSDEVEGRLPNAARHRRVFRYNRALALFKLGANEAAIHDANALVREYYAVIGIAPTDVIGRNPRELRPLLRQSRNLADDLKHLADTLDLQAQALGRTGRSSPFGRIHAMKFYELAGAPQSYVRVGQDLVDEFVRRNDFIGAREVLEGTVLPTIQGMGLVSWVIPVRAQYAVVLAYCGEHDAASAEMDRLAPYEAALNGERKAEIQGQRDLVRQLRRRGAPPQARIVVPPDARAAFDRLRFGGTTAGRRLRIGRNEACPCGSGTKYKHCHGR